MTGLSTKHELLEEIDNLTDALKAAYAEVKELDEMVREQSKTVELLRIQLEESDAALRDSVFFPETYLDGMKLEIVGRLMLLELHDLEAIELMYLK